MDILPIKPQPKPEDRRFKIIMLLLFVDTMLIFAVIAILIFR